MHDEGDACAPPSWRTTDKALHLFAEPMMTPHVSPPPTLRGSPVYWLALGTFAVGTESFMIAGILPRISQDFAVSAATAGQLVTVFALAYALFSPIMTALTSRIPRRTLLIESLAAFSVLNLLAAFAAGYWSLMVARVLLAIAAGLYVPGANALAGSVVAPSLRGRAIGVVNGGLTIAIALGVPLGTWVASVASWRMTFVGVALLSLVATLGLIYGLARDVGANLPVASLSERLRVAARPDMLMALLVTTLWATGAYSVYTYLAIYLQSETLLRGAAIGLVLFVWGVSAGAGVLLGGWGADRFGARRVVGPCLSLGALSFVLLSMIAHVIPPAYALAPVIFTTVLWGVSHWAFYPAQQSRLITLGGLRVAPVAMSLNASFMYLGFSLGAAAGSLALGTVGVANLGLVGASFVVLSLLLLRVTGRGESLLRADD